jgi:hypothetical protein
MPRGQSRSAEFTNFTGGLNTESTPLNSPENTVKDIQNFILNRDGSLQRRPGIEFEEGHEDFIASSDVVDLEEGLSTYIWKNASNSGIDVLCVQMGGRIYFFNASSTTPSAEYYGENVPISGYDYPNRYVASFTTVDSALVVTAGSNRVMVVSFDPLAAEFNRFSSVVQRVSVRDFWGTDGERSSRSSTIDNESYYNLINNGWPNVIGGRLVDNADAIGTTRLERGWFPAANDIWYAAKVEVADDPEAIGVYSSDNLVRLDFGSSEPVRGKSIIDSIFQRGASRQNFAFTNPPGVITDNYFTFNPTEIPEDRSTGHISALGEYLGRAVFGIRATGIVEGDSRSPNLSEMVFFSRTVRNINDISRCYGDNDPTAELINDPLDTDGGFVKIQGMGYPVNFGTLGRSLFVFATNGVWEISGGESSFTATNVVINKVSNVGCSSPRSVVNTEDSLYYWGDNGIYQISMDQISLQGIATNISEDRIQALFESLPFQVRSNVTGVFDEDERKVRWLYSLQNNPVHRDLHDRELVLDLRLGAFYKHYFAPVDDGTSEGPYLFGFVPSQKAISGVIASDVLVDADQVLAGAEEVVIDTVVTSTIRVPFKYASFTVDSASDDTFTLAGLDEETFVDWKSVDDVGTEAYGFLLTNALTGGDSQRKKQIPYVTVNMRLTDELIEDTEGGYVSLSPSSCLLRSQWGWTNNPETGRWGDSFQVYRLPRVFVGEAEGELNYGYDVVSTRNKLRGNGKALSLHFNTEAGHDCHIYGWGLNLTVNNFV